MTTDLFLGGLAVLVLAAIVIVLMTSNRRSVPSDTKTIIGLERKDRSQRDNKG